jgi:hypothetical protein
MTCNTTIEFLTSIQARLNAKFAAAILHLPRLGGCYRKGF